MLVALTDIRSMDHQQQDILQHSEQSNVHDWRQPLLDTMLAKVCTVVVLHKRLDDRDGHSPQRDQVECEALVDGSCPMEVVIPVHAQLLVLVFDNVVDDLSMKTHLVRLTLAINNYYAFAINLQK